MIKELEYPFDANYILSKKKKIKKRLLEEGERFTEKRIAILGGSTTHDIKLIVELFLLNNGIKPQFYESEYNQFYQDAMFENPVLEAFKPDIIYICTSNRNISQYPKLLDSPEFIEELVNKEVKKFTEIWERLSQKYCCPVIQNNFEMPFYRLLGNRDASDIHGRVNFIARINTHFYTYAQQHEDFYICDLNYISADFGLKEWADPFYWYMYKYALNVSAIPYLAFNVANIIKAVFGKNKKGMVLDCDNTLWGGVIGDDGVENILIGEELPEAEAFSEFQGYVRELKQLGIILNINSKNDYKNVILGLNHPDTVLKEEDFIVIKANWNAKDQNLQDIAEKLNLLPESLIFIDDNPAERELVKQRFPDISSPPLERVENYIDMIDRSGFFENVVLSGEDMKRNEMYKGNIKRQELMDSYENYNEYLCSLEMKGKIKAFEPMYFARIAQLTNKSNQFNLTTKRYTQTDIENVADDKNYITLFGRLEDKFGDNGVVSVIIGRMENQKCHIELWLMSCRVLKRDMEFAMMDALVAKCIEQGIRQIEGYYYPTAKNSMVKEFYALQGFEKIREDSMGNSEWIYEIPAQYKPKNQVITVED